MLHEDSTGRLWRIDFKRLRLQTMGDLQIAEVVNGTPEADGSRKTYWLRVPPWTKTSREAVAWTYGMSAEEYDGLCLRT